MAKQNEYTGPMRFAHRGLAQYAPENTLGAFEAAERGIVTIEPDKNYPVMYFILR